MTDAIPPLQKKLILVRGIPGNGKTTTAKMISDCEAIAADDMPGLYVNGVYQSHLQKDSHEWCKQEVRHRMLQQVNRIAVHNTFTRKIYIQPYLDLAAEHGYSVQIIHAEKIILPDGTSPKSIHNVPESVINSMQQGWENFTPIKKQGITLAQLHSQLNSLEYPDAILFDMDGTVKTTLGNHPFPKHPNDFQLTDYFSEWLCHFNGDIPLYLVSNQRGIGTGQKTIDFLKEEINCLEIFLNRNFDEYFFSSLFATHKDGKQCLVKDYGRDWALFQDCISTMDKPNTGMFDFILKTSLEAHENIWIVGNSHTDESPDDWIFAQNCQQKYPDLNIRYIPIEILNLARNITH